MGKRVVAHKFQLTGRRSITVKPQEFVMIRHILAHGMVKSPIVHDLYRHFASPKASSSVISNRLSKMREAGILGRIDIPYTYNNKVLNQSFYYAGDRSLIHLHALKQISEMELTRGLEIQQHKKIPNPQSQTMSQVVHSLFRQVEEHGEVEVRYTRSELHCIFQKEYRHKESLQNLELWPEWVLETELTVLCLIPVGSRIDNDHTFWELVFQQDLLKISEEVREQGKEFKVFFSFYDGSDKEENMKSDETMYESLKSTKESLTSPFTFPWSEHFSTYVLPLAQTVSKLSFLLHAQSFVGEGKSPSFSLRHIFPHLNYKGLHYEFQEEHEGQRLLVTNHECHHLHINEEKRIIWIYYTEEGSLEDYYHLRLLNQNLHDYTFLDEKERPDELWIVYETEEEAYRDTILVRNSNNVWFTSMEAWERISLHNFRFPPMLRMSKKSFYRRRTAAYLKDPIEWLEDFTHLYMPVVDSKDGFFYDEDYLDMLRSRLNKNPSSSKRWIWKPKTSEGLLLADAIGEIRISNQVQQVFIIQESTFVNVVAHIVELMRKWTINPEHYDYLGFKRSSSTKNPLLIVRLNDPDKVEELINRTAFYSTTMTMLIDAPLKITIDYLDNPITPYLYWIQGENREKVGKHLIAELILQKVANPI